MTQVKLLALDLDGTLTNSDKVVTPRTRAALQQAAQRGRPQTLCHLMSSVTRVWLASFD